MRSIRRLVVALGVLLMTACGSDSAEPVPLADARAEYREAPGPLQQAILPEAEAT